MFTHQTSYRFNPLLLHFRFPAFPWKGDPSEVPFVDNWMETSAQTLSKGPCDTTKSRKPKDLVL